MVPGLPVQVALRRFAALAVTADDPGAARALARAVLAHAATFHSPRDLRIVVCTRDVEAQDWAWVKWLPHAHHPEELDHVGPVRMLHGVLGVLEDWLGSELTRRTRFNRNAEPDADLPHLLVVLDGGAVTGGEALLDPNGMQGVTVLDLDGRAAHLTDAHGVRLGIADGTLSVIAGETREELGAADGLSTAEAEALAMQLAHYRVDAAATTADAEDLTTAVNTLPALLNVPDPGHLDLDALWRPRPIRDRLAVPIGVSADGGLLELDIKESALNGMGPHGLLVGATGSGKSELLRTLVLGMAATHGPDQLNFVLVDFKGGATFAGMAELPHVAAVITNLEDDLTLVDRMREALSGEMNRRQEVLRDAGNLVSVRDYERARQRGAALPPLPSLFIVVDEFSELLAQKPDFADLFVQIGRLGRSLGLHLLLASQRLDEGRLRGLEAHLSYRIGLRTFSESESRTAIGVTDAHHLPTAPGHGYLKTDTATLKRFRAAYVSGPYRTDGEDGGGAALGGGLDIRPFPAGHLPVPAAERAVPDPEPRPEPDEFDDHESLGSTVLGVMVEQMTGQGPQAHQVWLPPLDAGAAGRAARRPVRPARPRLRLRAGTPAAHRRHRHRRPALPPAARPDDGGPGGCRRAHGDRRRPALGQVHGAAQPHRLPRAASHGAGSAVLLPGLQRHAVRHGRAAAHRRRRRAAGRGERQPHRRRGAVGAGEPREPVPRAGRDLDGGLPRGARRGPRAGSGGRDRAAGRRLPRRRRLGGPAADVPRAGTDPDGRRGPHADVRHPPGRHRQPLARHAHAAAGPHRHQGRAEAGRRPGLRGGPQGAAHVPAGRPRGAASPTRTTSCTSSPRCRAWTACPRPRGSRTASPIWCAASTPPGRAPARRGCGCCPPRSPWPPPRRASGPASRSPPRATAWSRWSSGRARRPV